MTSLCITGADDVTARLEPTAARRTAGRDDVITARTCGQFECTLLCVHGYATALDPFGCPGCVCVSERDSWPGSG
jgi:hypothetical protein